MPPPPSAPAPPPPPGEGPPAPGGPTPAGDAAQYAMAAPPAPTDTEAYAAYWFDIILFLNKLRCLK